LRSFAHPPRAARRLAGAALVLCAVCSTSRLGADSTLVFNEIQYHPAANELGLEWIELYSQMAVDMDISGWSLSGGVDFLFPAGTIVRGGGFVVVAIDPGQLAAATGFAGAFGPFQGRLDNEGDRLEILNNSGRVMDSMRYRDGGDWPVAPDGSGVTLAKRDPHSASAPAENWSWSRQLNGTPGAHNFPDESGETPVGPQGLVSYWSFDDAGGTTADAIGGNNGTLGSTTARRAGFIGAGALSFDNSANAFVNVGAGAGNGFSVTTGIAIEALIVPQWGAAAADGDMIFRKEDGSNRIVFGFQNDGNADGRSLPAVAEAPYNYAGPVLSFGLNVGGVYSELDMPLDGLAGRPALAALKDGQPHHVAAVFDSASGRKTIYVDGQSAFSVQLAAGARAASGGASAGYLGNMTGRSQPFTGAIDEVAFWNRPLSAAEVQAHVQAFRSGQSYFSNGSPGGGEAASLAFNEFAFAGGGDYWVELANTGGAPVEVGGHAIAPTNLSSVVALPARLLAPGEFLAVSRAQLGFDLFEGDGLFLFSPDSRQVVDAMRTCGSCGRSPDGTGRWLSPESQTPGAANQFRFEDSMVINEILYHQRAEGAQEPVVEETVILPIGASWKYDASGNDLGTAWRAAGFNDAAWPSGTGLFYNEDAELPAAKSTLLNLGIVTYYFRTTFQFNGDPQSSEVRVRAVIDDGAVFYLNGVEVLRVNIPDGDVNAGTLASPGVANAGFTGPYSLDRQHLRQGANTLAVELHQASAGSSDVVFGAEISAGVVLEPGHPYRESPEAWLELYNRGAAPVDLTGWKLAGGIDFAFEPGTVVGSGGYLVIAADGDFLAAKYPALRIAGSFEGRLSHRSDRIALLDSRGNPADEVRYFDAGRWPEYADAGGSSLELRNPFADNSKAESWAASDETGRSQWRTYRYRETASTIVGPEQWSEFVIGLLDSGEALLDDLSVIEQPGAAGRELLQNGAFENAATAWRILGNHRHSRVIVDPANAANHVLHLVATGATEHMHNHLETTLAGGARIVNGREYEISFRAKWLGGSNQFNTRLYFNRAPQTTLLDVPDANGTPGARNSRFVDNPGPVFEDFRHGPVVPDAAEPVVVSVRAADPDGVRAVSLWHSVAGGAWQRTAMAQSGGAYTATIPGQSASQVVQFYVEAEDSRGALAMFPARGRDSRALYKVQDGQARAGVLHNFRFIMTTADANFLHLDTNVQSNEYLGCTIVYRESEAYYDCGIRLKGSQRGRVGGSRVSFVARFDPERPFRGIHESVSLDRSGGWGIGAGPTGQDEIIIKHGINHAGALPGMYDDMAWLIAPRSAQNGQTLVMMAKYTSHFLDSYLPNGSDGNLFKVELIYYPTTTVGGNPEGLKLPQPDIVVGTDLRDLGDDKEPYRWTFLAENNYARDDYSRFIELCKTLSLSGAAFESRIESILDVDETTRMYAAHTLCGISDTYWFAENYHNVMVYEPPAGGLFQFFAWDNDVAYARSVSAPLWSGPSITKLYSFPRFQRLFYQHVQDLTASTFNAAYITRWTDHYGTLAQETASFNTVRNYITQRSNFAITQLPARAAFAITTNSGNDFTVNALTTTIEGSGWIDVRSVLAEDRDEPLELSWTAVNRWRAELRLFSGANAITLFAFNIAGDLVGTDSITITSTVNLPAPVIATVIPAVAPPGTRIAIDGANFSDGLEVHFGSVEASDVDFDSAADPDTILVTVPDLPPGAIQLAVRNPDGKFSNAVSFETLAEPGSFVRGDANGDGLVNLSDAVKVLVHLFRAGSIACADAADVNDSETIEVTDAVVLLEFLFRLGRSPAPPYPAPGVDPSGATLGCGP
jgi:hypothetical protein